MIFVESRLFTRDREEYLDDEGLRALETALLDNPEAGAVIRGTEGLRKLRWMSEGSGKRGGLRVIYYLITRDERCLLLLLYKKGVQDDLTRDQERLLMRLVQAEAVNRSQ